MNCLFLAVKWFRGETNIEIIQGEIHEMETDFHNIPTNGTTVIIRKINNILLIYI